MAKKTSPETDNNKAPLTGVRDRIDAIDLQILKLLKERLECAREIGRLKSLNNRAKWDPRRERQIFERLRKLNSGDFPEQPLTSIFREIITTCRLSQKPVEVGYLGPEATFSNMAAVKYFGHGAKFMPMPSFEDIFHDVEHGRIDYGIVPVENSIEGSVTSALDSFIKYSVTICGEVNLAIKHNLVNYSGNIDDVKMVVSHSQPLAQCQSWLRGHLPGVTVKTAINPDAPYLDRIAISTATAAQMAQADHSLAAIASDLAIKTYDLQVVARGIEDYRGNTTRFLVIGKASPSRSGRDKTSLLLSLVDRPGALYHCLNILADREINLTKIESRPIKGEAGKYMFFIDFAGHLEDPSIKEACDRLRETCASFKWLGSYPQAEENDI